MGSLSTKNISKQYPGTLALNDISVFFDSGKVHSFIGKNGSGKSTLLKIFSGAVSQTSGKIFIDEQEVDIKDPMDAFNKGIATVYQELSLVPGLSVAENIFLERMPSKGMFIDIKKTYEMARDILNELEIDIDVKELVKNLSVGQCQMVEIAKAMSFNPKVLQLDEPTSALAKNEIQSLFKVIRKLKEKDVIIIYVSHRLHELWEIADTCTVIRDGQYVGTALMSDVTNEQLVSMMFGDLEIKKKPESINKSEEVIFEISNFTRKNKFENISFKLKKGEVLGIAGMLGSGRTELLRSIFGADGYDSGDIIFDGKKIKTVNPNSMKKLGFALTPEDRKNEGLIQIHSVRENLVLASLDAISNGYFINGKKESSFVNSSIKDLQIKLSSPEEKVSSLSGGNQQKIVVGNWLNTKPKVIFFDEPSRGIDVLSKQQIFQIMWQQAELGVSSIMVSSELEELLEVCDRILIMYSGKIINEVYPKDLGIEELYSKCMGGETNGK